MNKAQLYVDGHSVELWEGTRQVALLTRSNLPLNSGDFLLLRARPVGPSAWERSTVGEVMSKCQVPPAPLCVIDRGAFSAGAPRRCVREGSMSAMERTTYRRSLGSNAWAFDEPRRDPQHASRTSGPSTDSSSDDSIPLFLSDLQGQPDPRDAPLAASQRTSILTRVVAGGLVVSAFAILVAVGVFNSNVTRVLIDKARVSMGSATEDQSATQAASNQPASVNTPSREDIVSAYHTALQSQTPAARTGNEAAVPSKTLDAETLAALMTRAKSLLALGDIAAARLLLERAANAEDASAAFLLAQTYDPAVLGVRDTRSITADLVMARDWYRKAASFGSADAQQRLTQLQN